LSVPKKILQILKVSILVAIGGMPMQARASDPETLLTIFDSLCVGTQIDQGAILTVIKDISFLGPNATSAPLPIEVIRSGNPDNKAGWKLRLGDEVYMLSYAEKPIEGRVSKSCTVLGNAVDAEDLKKELEEAYRVKELFDERQGMSRVVAYDADLIGMPRQLGISIQVGLGRAKGMGTVAIFELVE
jgi:hypothetical protein